MINIPRHKVFISYYHEDDQDYKDALIQMRAFDYSRGQHVSIFDDYSVHEDEIDDTYMTDEEIRCEIRDGYIKHATVLVLLCGANTSKRKHIDWEIHAAMYDSEANPQMGILVINVDGDNGQIACGSEEEKIIAPNIGWVPLNKDIASLRRNYPNLPDRIIENIARDNVSITVANWNSIGDNPEKIKVLIDTAYNRRKSNCCDHSTPLRGRNSK
jgi:hypothetical protein